MNKYIINIVIFAAGVGAGFFLANHLLKANYIRMANEEVRSVKDAFEKRKHAPDNSIEKRDQPTESVKNPYLNPVAQADKSLIRESFKTNNYERAQVAYNLVGIIDEEDSEEELTPLNTEPIDAQLSPIFGVDRTKPYLISDVEYSTEFDHHDKISLYFYRVDGVLCEENEEQVEDPDRLVGDESIKELDTESCVWVRNEPMLMDFEIVAVNGSYAEQVHGISVALSPREMYDRKMKNKHRRLDD